MLSSVAMRPPSAALAMCRTRRSSAPPALRVPCQSPVISWAAAMVETISNVMNIKMRFMRFAPPWAREVEREQGVVPRGLATIPAMTRHFRAGLSHAAAWRLVFCRGQFIDHALQTARSSLVHLPDQQEHDCHRGVEPLRRSQALGLGDRVADRKYHEPWNQRGEIPRPDI